MVALKKKKKYTMTMRHNDITMANSCRLYPTVVNSTDVRCAVKSFQE